MAKHSRLHEQRHGFAYVPSKPDLAAPVQPLPSACGLIGLVALANASEDVAERLARVLRLAKYEDVEAIEAAAEQDAVPQIHDELVTAIHSFCDSTLGFPTVEASNVVGAYVGLRLKDQHRQTDDAVAVALIQGGQPSAQADRDMLRDVRRELHARGYNRQSLDRLERDGRLFAVVHVDHFDNLDTAIASGVPLSKQALSKACRKFYLAFGAPLMRGPKGYLAD